MPNNIMSVFHANVSPEGRIVSYAIVILVIVACVLWARAYRRVWATERRVLTLIRNAPAPDNAVDAENLLETYAGTDVSSALRMAMQSRVVDPDSLECFEWIHWPRQLAGIFVFIGLVGTVWGIATAISSLGITVAATSQAAASSSGMSSATSAFTMERWSQLLTGIDRLLVGMSSASVCTLVGLLATILVSMLNALYLATCRQVATDVATYATDRLFPLLDHDLTGPDGYNLVNALKSSVKHLASAAGSLSAEVSPAAKALAEVGNKATGVVEQLQESAKHLEQEFGRVQQSYSHLQTVMAELPTESYRTLEQTARELGSAVNELSLQRESITQAIRLLREEMVAANKEYTKELAGVGQGLTHTHDHLGELLRQFEKTLLDVGDIAETSPVRQEIERLRAQLTQTSDTLSAELRDAEERLAEAARSRARNPLESAFERSTMVRPIGEGHVLTSGSDSPIEIMPPASGHSGAVQRAGKIKPQSIVGRLRNWLGTGDRRRPGMRG